MSKHSSSAARYLFLIGQRMLRWVYGLKLVEEDRLYGAVYMDCMQPATHVAGSAIGMLVGLAAPQALTVIPDLQHSTLIDLQVACFLVSLAIAFPHLILLFCRLGEEERD